MAGAELLKRGIETRARIVVAIRAHVADHGVPPTLAEIAASVGVVRSAVAYHRRILREQGWVSFDDSRYRSTRVIPPRARYVGVPYGTRYNTRSTSSEIRPSGS